MQFNNWVALYVQMLFAVIMLLPVLIYGDQESLSITTDALPLVLFAAILKP